MSNEDADYAAYLAQEVTGQPVAVYSRDDLRCLNIEYIADDVVEAMPRNTLIKCYCAVQQRHKMTLALNTALAEAFCTPFAVTSVITDDEAYLNKWKESFHPIAVSNVTVTPYADPTILNIESNTTNPTPATADLAADVATITQCRYFRPIASPVNVVIDTNLAFGTGQHETTALMLYAAQQLKLTGGAVLDVGCGSGILSVTAALLGACTVDALDYDEECIVTTKRNAILNNVKLDAFASNLLSAAPRRVYDVVMANITLNILTQLAPQLHRVTRKGSLIVLSGVLDCQRDALMELYGGFARLVGEYVLNEWRLFIYEVM